MRFIRHKRLQVGDRVSLLTTSSSVAAHLPHVVDLAVHRMRADFGLEPVVGRNALNPHITLMQRAEDLHESFADSSIKAVFAMTGGMEQIHLIPLLDPLIFKDNTKLFFGFSDNTNLTNFLFGLGIPSLYGGSVLTQFGMPHNMHKETVDGLKWALFGDGWFTLQRALEFTEDERDWTDPIHLNLPRKHLPNRPVRIIGEMAVEGPLWGGCLESLHDIFLMPDRCPDSNALEGSVLFLETSQELPSHAFVERFLIRLGALGVLSKLKAIALGRPKAAFLGEPHDLQVRAQYRQEQEETLLRICSSYNSKLTFALNLDFGHTDPQYPLPCGGLMRIDCAAQRVCVHL